jgi:hypothetical protein
MSTMAPDAAVDERRVSAFMSGHTSLNFDELIIMLVQIVGVNAETVTHVSSTDFPGHYPREDHSWNIKNFKEVSLPVPISSRQPFLH